MVDASAAVASAATAAAASGTATNPTPASTINNIINGKGCTTPVEMYSIATALTVLFASELSQKELNTLINLLALVVAGLSAIVTQQEICEGIPVQPTV